MALTKGDKDWFKDTLLEFHREVDEPRLNEILGDIKDLKKDVNVLKQDVEELKSEVGHFGKRMDKLSEIVTDVKTNHEKRIRRLEKEAGVEPLRAVVM